MSHLGVIYIENSVFRCICFSFELYKVQGSRLGYHLAPLNVPYSKSTTIDAAAGTDGKVSTIFIRT